MVWEVMEHIALMLFQIRIKAKGAKADGNNMVTYFDGVSRPYQIIPDNTSHFFRTGLTATNSAIISAHSGNTGLRFTFTDMRNKGHCA